MLSTSLSSLAPSRVVPNTRTNTANTDGMAVGLRTPMVGSSALTAASGLDDVGLVASLIEQITQLIRELIADLLDQQTPVKPTPKPPKPIDVVPPDDDLDPYFPVDPDPVIPPDDPTDPVVPTPVDPDPEPPIVAPDVKPEAPTLDKDFDYRKQSVDERTASSTLTPKERAIFHLWGIQMTSVGKQNGGITFNVLKNPELFTAAEVALAKEIQDADKAEFGAVNGKNLDKQFFALMKKVSGKDLAAKYANAPAEVSTAPINIDNRASADNGAGLSAFEKAIMRYWGHDPLMKGNNGKVTGGILAYTLAAGAKSLDPDVDTRFADFLLKTDLGSDGVVNGDTMEAGFEMLLDKLYLDGPDVTGAKISTYTQNRADLLKRSKAQMAKDATNGVKLAVGSAAKMIADHPVVTSMAVGAGAIALGTCPFLAGTMAAGVAVAAGQKLMTDLVPGQPE